MVSGDNRICSGWNDSLAGVPILSRHISATLCTDIAAARSSCAGWEHSTHSDMQVHPNTR
jgi:hypothetical protein